MRISHPLTRDLDLDDVRVTLARRHIIENKRFLRAIYLEWYSLLKNKVGTSNDILEIGSGAGFLKDVLPAVTTSEVFVISNVDRVEDACRLSYPDASLNAILMVDVFHHIPDARAFLSEACRVLRKGGKIVMIEPWVTRWSSWIYRHLHHEPFDPKAIDWSLPVGGGPLSNANGALPWIVFERDKRVFESEFPELAIVQIEPLMPLSYLASGGVGTRLTLPRGLYRWIRLVERRILKERGAMFSLLVLQKA